MIDDKKSFMLNYRLFYQIKYIQKSNPNSFGELALMQMSSDILEKLLSDTLQDISELMTCLHYLFCIVHFLRALRRHCKTVYLIWFYLYCIRLGILFFIF